MERLEYADITVDRCKRCRGLWFDKFEREKLLELPGSEAVDEGPNSVTRRLGDVDKVDCPRCNVRMVQLVDTRHPDVHFEQCADCGGSFLDAGEFRAMKPRTLAGVLRELFR